MANEQDIIVRLKAEGTKAFINNVKAAGDSVGKVGDEVEETEKKVEKSTDKMSSSFKSIGKVIGAAFATQQLIAFTKRLVSLAVELDATEAKYKKVFGSASRIIEDFAKKNANALGLTVAEFKNAAAAAGDLLIPLGFQRKEAAKLSTDLVKLSGALSAWSNGQFDAKQTADILTKALLGEREQLKTLGISIQEADVKQRLLDKGQQKLTGSTLAQAKATATLELITEKSADAQAAFSDDTVTLAEASAKLGASLRQIVEGLAEDFIPVLGNAANAIEKASAAWKRFNDRLTNRAEKDAFAEQIAGLETQLELTIAYNNKLGEIADLEKKAERDFSGATSARLSARRAELAIIQAEIDLRNEPIVEPPPPGGGGVGDTDSLIVNLSKLQQTVDTLTVSESEALLKLRELQAEFAKTATAAELFQNSLLEGTGLQVSNSTQALIDKVNQLTKATQAQAFASDQAKEAEIAALALNEERVGKALDGITGIATAQDGAFNAFSQFQQAELQILQNKFDSGLIGEKEYQQEKGKIQEKQARADKANAIFNATINIATAVTKAFAQGGGVFGGILAGIVTAAGIAQIAAIAKTPIPKFAKGTRLVGDGYELGEDRTLAWLNKGERVITAQDNKKKFALYNAIEENDTNRIMLELAKQGIAVQFNGGLMMDDLNKPLKSLADIKGNAKKNGIDLNPLLTASDRQRVTLARKLDILNDNVSKLGNSIGRVMTQA